VLVFLAVAGGADLLPDGAGAGRLRIVRHGRIGEAGSDVEGVHRLRILAAEMRGREVVGIGGGGAFLRGDGRQGSRRREYADRHEPDCDEDPHRSIPHAPGWPECWLAAGRNLRYVDSAGSGDRRQARRLSHRSNQRGRAPCRNRSTAARACSRAVPGSGRVRLPLAIRIISSPKIIMKNWLEAVAGVRNASLPAAISPSRYSVRIACAGITAWVKNQSRRSGKSRPSPITMRCTSSDSRLMLASRMLSPTCARAEAGGRPDRLRSCRRAVTVAMWRSMIAWARPALSPKTRYSVDIEPPACLTISLSEARR